MSLLINEKLAQSYATLKWYCSDLCSHKCCVLIAVNVNDVCFVIKLCFGFHFLFSVCSFSGEQWLSLCPLETDSFPPMCESNIQELGLSGTEDHLLFIFIDLLYRLPSCLPYGWATKHASTSQSKRS